MSVLGFFFFVWRELVYKNPIVDLRVLKNGNLRIGTVLSFVMGFGLYGSTFVIPLYTQGIMGWTATQSGLLMLPAALMTAFMMPFIGQMLGKGVSQPLLISLGMVAFFVYSFWGYKIITPDTGKDTFFWMLIVRGIGLAMLFIPITAMSLSSLKGMQIGQGAAFTGMARQLGGSFGIALITTFVSRRNQLHRNDLVSDLDINNPIVANRLHAMQASFMQKGADASTALKRAYQSLEYAITKQQTVLSYMDVFLYLGVLFLIFVPLVLLVKNKKQQGKLDPSAMH